MNPPFELNKELLSEKVVNYIRKQILLREYAQGSHLSEVELSKKMNISRGPVREAIRQLEHEGLVYTPNNGRTLVVGFTQEDLADLFDVRKQLEIKAIGTIVERNLERNVTQLERILEKSKQTNTISELISLDVQFHLHLVSMSGNRTLIKLWSVISGLITTLIEITTDIYEKLDKVPETHWEIIEAIRVRDADKASKLLAEHLDTGEAVIRGKLDKLG